MILNEGRTVAQGAPDVLKNKIGADVISIQTREPQKVAEEAQRRWNCTPSVVSGLVRIEIRDGHKFIPTLIEAMPGLITSIQLGKPTLEDVFVHETGQSFSSEVVA
jgi:ABC-2 type transport system ATP-binding protein